MNKVLFINLRRFGDIFSSAHIASKLKDKFKNVEISILIFKEFESGLKPLPLFKNVYVIDRKKIATLKNNDIFPDHMALDNLFDSIDKIQKNKYDTIINLSNDLISTNIISYLNFNNTADVKGIYFNRDKNIVFNSNWSIVFNDILTSYPYTPIHFVDCFKHMLDLDTKNVSEKITVSQIKYEKIAKNNFNQIKKIKFKNPEHVKIIGIQLKTSSIDKDIPKDVLIELIEKYKNHGSLLPVLLTSTSEEEKKFANQINSYFENSLISIESDFLALPSVLNNIDLIVTPDTSVKHVADLNKTKILEVIYGHAPFLKQGTYNEGNAIIVNSNNLIKSNSINEANHPKSSEIYRVSLFCLNYLQSEDLELPNDILYFESKKDSLGTMYELKNKISNQTVEKNLLNISISRHLIFSILLNKEPHFNVDDFLIYKVETIQKWIKDQKEDAINLMKDLLDTLKSLINLQRNHNQGLDFAQNLDNIFNCLNNNSLVSIPALIFRAKIENIGKGSMESNMKVVEGLLYEFKTNIQKIILILDQLSKILKQPIKKKSNNIQRPNFL